MIKIIKILTVLAVFQLLNSCGEAPPSPDNQLTIANFAVTPDTISIKPGESIKLNAYLNDTLNSKKIPLKEVFWQIIAGPGTISSNSGHQITYTTPSSVTAKKTTVLIKAYPEMDMRWEKNLKVFIINNLPPQPKDTTMCFKRDILPIIYSNCANPACHDSKTKEEGYDLSTYNTIISRGVVPGNPNKSKLYTQLFKKGEDQMPPPPKTQLSAEQKEKIRRWIAEGAKNGDCAPLVSMDECDTTTISFTKIVVPIFQNNCYGCHNPQKPQGSINLQDFAKVKSLVDRGIFWKSVNHQTGAIAMPSKDLMLSECELKQLEKWIAAGAPNN
jgi:hypothetical protein